MKNALPWVTAVRMGEIESRLLVTNKAITDVILSQKPNTVLDIGCGEGWLVRELNKAEIKSIGIDAVAELIEHAQNEGGGKFKTISYDGIAKGEVKEKFDVIVCNFSLLGKESVDNLFQYMPSMLNTDGAFIIQTIHPEVDGDENYKDGWREGSWAGFNAEFSDPAPWYYRTLDSWKSLFIRNGLKLREILEPLNEKTNAPASIIFIGVKV